MLLITIGHLETRDKAYNFIFKAFFIGFLFIVMCSQMLSPDEKEESVKDNKTNTRTRGY